MKTKKVTKSMKYKIHYNKILCDILKNIQYETWKLKNESVTRAWDYRNFYFSYNDRFGEKFKLGKTLVADIYNELLDKYGVNMSSSTYNSAIKEAVDKFNEQTKKGEKVLT